MDVEIISSQQQQVREPYLAKGYEEPSLGDALYEAFATFISVYKYKAFDRFDVTSLIYIFFILLFGCLTLYYLGKMLCGGGRSRNRVLKKKAE